MAKSFKTSMEAISEIRESLELADVYGQTLMTGQIYEGTRQLNSKLEDIVINSLGLSFNQFQDGRFNVNCYVPNLIGQPSGVPNARDNTRPDFDRLKTFGGAVVSILNEVWLHDSFFYVENAGEIIPDGNDHFFNIRVRYNAFRKDQ